MLQKLLEALYLMGYTISSAQISLKPNFWESSILLFLFQLLTLMALCAAITEALFQEWIWIDSGFSQMKNISLRSLALSNSWRTFMKESEDRCGSTVTCMVIQRKRTASSMGAIQLLMEDFWVGPLWDYFPEFSHKRLTSLTIEIADSR